MQYTISFLGDIYIVPGNQKDKQVIVDLIKTFDFIDPLLDDSARVTRANVLNILSKLMKYGGISLEDIEKNVIVDSL